MKPVMSGACLLAFVQCGNDGATLPSELVDAGVASSVDSSVRPTNLDAQVDTATPTPEVDSGSIAIGTIKNPVLEGLYADPQIALFNGIFYIYPTTDGYANWTSPLFKAFSSTDLATWKDEGTILTLGTDITWATDKAWAPGIAFQSGTYYYYFAADQAIGVAKGSTPLGPFKDALGHELVKKGSYGVQTIDPYAFIDDDGRAYLYFGSGGARAVELNADMISFKGTPQTLTAAGFREASVMFKRKGKYYFMWSENDTRNANYQVSYAIGTAPLGPFTKANVNPILSEDVSQGILATGHSSVINLPSTDTWYIVYHRFKIPGGDGTDREVCIDKLLFNADGTIIPVKPTL